MNECTKIVYYNSSTIQMSFPYGDDVRGRSCSCPKQSPVKRSDLLAKNGLINLGLLRTNRSQRHNLLELALPSRESRRLVHRPRGERHRLIVLYGGKMFVSSWENS